MAIALDTSVYNSAANTWSHTCTGNALILFVGGTGDLADNLTGITYNGVSMTAIGKVQTSGDRYVYLYYLIAPATGAHNVVVTGGSFQGFSVSYSGVKQSGVPDASTTNTANAATSITTSVNTVLDNCWTIVVVNGENPGPAPTAGAGTNIRQHVFNYAIADSNGLIHPAGSTSLIINNANSTNWGSVMASFAPIIQTTVSVTDTIAFSEKETANNKFTVTDNISFLESVKANISMTWKDTISFLESLKSNVSIKVTDTIAFAESLKGSISMKWTDTISFIESISVVGAIAITVTDTIAFAEKFIGSVSSKFTDTISFSESVIGSIKTVVFKDTISFSENLTIVLKLLIFRPTNLLINNIKPKIINVINSIKPRNVNK